ncbi:MAG: aminotransferase class V-fold PLP-dependent enzyme [Antricoccus sp.]
MPSFASHPRTITDIAEEFSSAVCYLNTATMGLPSLATVRVLEETMRRWQSGVAQGSDFDEPIQRARELYANLVNTDAGSVAIGSQASALAGLIAANLDDTAEVLVALSDFTSVSYPFLAQQSRGVQVRTAPLAELVDEVHDSTTLVAVSAVQSANGAIADLAALRARCTEVGARILLDLTQASGWFEVCAADYAYTICSAYKWLMGQRGGAFLTVSPECRDSLIPHSAGWFAGQNPWSSVYADTLELADDARRFDVSPAWHSWASLVPSLELVTALGRPVIEEHSVGLANACADRLGLPRPGGPILSVPISGDISPVLERAEITAAIRAGALRLSFYIYNNENDVDRAVEAIAAYVVR